LLPESRVEIGMLRPYHLAAMGLLCVLMLIAARVRLVSLLRHG
jgi:hypothetical protein